LAEKLHRCRNRAKFRPRWSVQEALDDQGISCQVARGPWRPKNRTAVIKGTGQTLYPAIQFEDGSGYREESKGKARTIRDGRLMETQRGGVDRYAVVRMPSFRRCVTGPWPLRRRLRRGRLTLGMANPRCGDIATSVHICGAKAADAPGFSARGVGNTGPTLERTSARPWCGRSG
jgi:hypothetical protein